MSCSRMVKAHTSYVWTLFNSVILCVGMLWAISGLQPVEVRPVPAYPKSAIPVVAPPNRPIGGRPVAFLRPGFIPPVVKFIEYVQYREISSIKTCSPYVDFLFAHGKGVAGLINFSKNLTYTDHPGPEWTRKSYTKNFYRIFRKPFYRKPDHFHVRFIPPPAYWVVSWLVMRRERGQLSPIKRSCRSLAEIRWYDTLIKQEYIKEQFFVVQLFHSAKDRLQHLQILRF